MADRTGKPALTCGVIGHRPNRLPADPGRLVQVEAEIADTLAAIALMTEMTAPRTDLVLVDALAEGADTMAAQVALASGRFSLVALLPFPVALYRDDFADDEARAALTRLVAAAAQVVELPGSRRDADGAYEAVGLAIVERSDVLIAIWDGGPSAGRGGTTEMLEAAAQRDVPIVHIDARGGVPTRVLWHALEPGPPAVPGLAGLPSAAFVTGMRQVVDALLSGSRAAHGR